MEVTVVFICIGIILQLSVLMMNLKPLLFQ